MCNKKGYKNMVYNILSDIIIIRNSHFKDVFTYRHKVESTTGELPRRLSIISKIYYDK